MERFKPFKETDDIKFIKTHADEIWDIMQRSYAPIGGFLTYKNIDDMLERVGYIRYGDWVNNTMSAAALYSKNKGGFKLVGCGTKHGEQEEKDIIYDIIKDDAEEYSQWHWAEVSGPMERIFQKCGGNPIPAELAKQILGKEDENFIYCDDAHYKRLIGGKYHTKILYGFKNHDVYTNVLNNIADMTGFKTYEDWKTYTNSQKVERLNKGIQHRHKPYNRADLCIDACDIFIDLWEEENLYEIPKMYYDFMLSIVKELRGYNFSDSDMQDMKDSIIRSVTYILRHICIITINEMKSIVEKITAPILKQPKPISGKIEDLYK